jgi:YkoY family integral membrane protein
MWGLTFSDVMAILGAVASLVVLEGLFSGDNALVLAVMVRHLPKESRKRALRYGMWGAFGFRLIAVLLADYMLQFWWLKVLGGLYLLQIALRHFLVHVEEHESSVKTRFGSGFWGTVVSVEFADLAFSIDSILAAMAVARGLPASLQNNHSLTIGIVWLGGVLGIVMMRYVAGVFIYLLERFKGLAGGAYWLVAWIGLKLIGGGFHDAFIDPLQSNIGWRGRLPLWLTRFPWEMNDWIFWAGMLLIVVISLLIPSNGKDRGESSALAEIDEPTSPNGTVSAQRSDTSHLT